MTFLPGTQIFSRSTVNLLDTPGYSPPPLFSILPFFVQVDQGTLFELILAANYLDIKGLLDVTCKTVANMIKGEEIENKFCDKLMARTHS